MRRSLGLTNPHPEILRWYVEMGGERVIFSSDAHEPAHVGLHVDRAVQIAKTAGITKYTAYERRRPRLLPLL
jgi:histidinol-phosphatase (PHP family)